MPAQVIVTHKWSKITDQGQPGIQVVDTTSKARDWRQDLSPFSLGPCELYDGHTAQNVENAWQYTKVYKRHTDNNGEPTNTYWIWAKKGWADPEPQRYPMGKGAIPEYSIWKGQKLGYIEARKQIYTPLFAQAVTKTDGYKILVGMYNACDKLYLRDWDGWNMAKHGMTSLTDVLNNPRRKMGHAFVLKMLLEDDPALLQCDINDESY